jgi:hypothetical protein
MMGRWKKDGNHSPSNNKLVQEPEGNEENRYPDSDSNKTKITYTKEPNKAHQNILKEGNLQVIFHTYYSFAGSVIGSCTHNHTTYLMCSHSNQYICFNPTYHPWEQWLEIRGI